MNPRSIPSLCDKPPFHEELLHSLSGKICVYILVYSPVESFPTLVGKVLRLLPPSHVNFKRPIKAIKRWPSKTDAEIRKLSVFIQV